MKKEYIAPEMEIEKFSLNSSVTTSEWNGNEGDVEF
jgi:hypothetical protein